MVNKNKFSMFSIMLLIELMIIAIIIILMYKFELKDLSIISTIICVFITFFVNVIRNNGKLDISSPAFLYSLFYFAFFGLGFLFLDTSGDSVKNINIVSITIIIGAISIALCSFFESKYKSETIECNITTSQLNKSVIFSKIIFILGVIGFSINIIKVGTLPIFLTDLEQGRVEASLAISGYVRILVYLLIPSGIISFNNYLELKKRNTSFTTSFLMWILSIVLLLTLGNRSPAFTIILISILIFIFNNGSFKFSVFKLIKYGIPTIIITLVFVGGIGAYRVINTPSMWNYVEYKPLLDQKKYFELAMFSFFHYFSIGVNNFIDMLKVVPHIIPLQYGKTYVMPLMTILPGTQYTLDIQIKNALGQTYLGGGTIPSFLGEAYINFGLVGAIVSPVISLKLIESLRKQFLIKKSVGNKIIYVYIFFYLCYSQLAGIASTSVFPIIAIAIFVVYNLYVYRS